MTKEELRNKYKIIRKEIVNKEQQNKYIYNKIICEEHIKNDTSILIYVSFNDEVDTINLIKYFIKNKYKVGVPKVNGNNIDFYYINSFNELEKGSFNILEPTTNNKVINFNNSICIVPGLCFDKNNNRIGYGKGYYDRFLSNKDIYTIGLSFKECIVDKIKTDSNDIKLNKVLYKK